MSSQRFESTFDSASNAIIAKHGRPTVQTILDDIRRRASESSVTNPLKNRRLFLDAEESSQMIGVKCRDYQIVIDELTRLGLVHVWKRAFCPFNQQCVIKETNEPSEFQKIGSKTCPYCGNQHESLPNESIETAYAINFTLADKPMGIGQYLLTPNSHR